MLTEWSPKREAEVNHRTELAGMARLRMVVGRILKKREKKKTYKNKNDPQWSKTIGIMQHGELAGWFYKEVRHAWVEGKKMRRKCK